jgi:two-component system, OmpR family, response regulator
MSAPMTGATGNGDGTRIAPWPRADVVPVAVPLAARELVAQLVALHEKGRDAPTARSVPKRLRFSGWVLDLGERRLVAPGGGVARLPGIEFTLLRAFAARPRRVLGRSDLAQLIQRDGSPCASPRAIDVYVSRLRRILSQGGGASLISTAWRTGYALDADVVRV